MPLTKTPPAHRLRVALLRRAGLATALLTALAAWNARAEPVEQQVDPARDLIVLTEAAAAPHELVVYFSPGCPACLALYEKTIGPLARIYVGLGDLRLVYRMVPQRFHAPDDPERRETARRISHSLALMVHCWADSHRAERAGKALAMVYELVALLNADPAVDASAWPYLSEAGQARMGALVAEIGLFDVATMGQCFAPSAQAEMDALFARNLALLEATAGGAGAGVPLYVLDGEPISNQGRDLSLYPGAIYDALERAIR